MSEPVVNELSSEVRRAALGTLLGLSEGGAFFDQFRIG
jgi:hypothetical protein